MATIIENQTAALKRYIPNVPYSTVNENGVQMIIWGDDEKNVAYTACVVGRQTRPTLYRHKDAERAFDYINGVLAKRAERLESKNEYAQEKKNRAAEMFEKMEVGSILNTCWGYDQTNYEFYQVIEKIGKSTVIIQQVCVEVRDDLQYPIKDKFYGKPLRKKVTQDGVGTKYSSATASPWSGNGKPLTQYR